MSFPSSILNLIYAMKSDTPFALALSALEGIPVLTGTQDTGFNFSIYTGDLVSHDPDNQLSREYVLYTEVGSLRQDTLKAVQLIRII